MKYVKGIGASLTLTVIVSIIGAAMGWDLKYLSGWWACMAYSHFVNR